MAVTSVTTDEVECFECDWPVTEWGSSTPPVTGEGQEEKRAAAHVDQTGHTVEIRVSQLVSPGMAERPQT